MSLKSTVMCFLSRGKRMEKLELTYIVQKQTPNLLFFLLICKLLVYTASSLIHNGSILQIKKILKYVCVHLLVCLGGKWKVEFSLGEKYCVVIDSPNCLILDIIPSTGKNLGMCNSFSFCSLSLYPSFWKRGCEPTEPSM